MEDIDYLKANSHKYSYMLYIDSAKRNRAVHGEPNHYRIDFNTPFKNVYSVQVLDASIPRTHYNVDNHNNRLYFIIRDEHVDGEHYIDMDIGDYNDLQLLEHVNTKFQMYLHTLPTAFKNKWNNGFITMDYVSSPPEIRKQYLFKAPFEFDICTYKSSMRETLGFDAGAHDVMHAIDDHTHYQTTTILNSLGDDTTMVNIHSRHTMMYQRFIAPEFGHLESIRFNIGDILETFRMNVRVFRYDHTTNHRVEVAHALNYFNVELHTHTVVFSDFIHTHALEYGKEYFIQVYAFPNVAGDDTDPRYAIYTHAINNNNSFFISTNDSVTRFDPTRREEFAAGLFVLPDIGESVASVFYGLHSDVQAQTQLSLEMNMHVSMSTPMWSITPPGVYNLIGDRYVILRCPEIENHILSSIKSYNTFNAITNTTEEKQYESGIAKFKMGVVGYREERFDFNLLPPYEFHPIGKLTALTFAFENQDGIPYNFRGVNHTVTIVINYYKPTISYDTRIQVPSKLYPPYNPNQLVYSTNDDIYDPEQ